MTSMFKRYAAIFLLPVLVAGCSMSTPSQLRTGQVQLREDAAVHTYALADMGKGQVRALAHDHAARGRGPVSVTVSYPEGDSSARKTAQADMRRVLSQLQAEGVKGTKVDYVAVSDSRLAGQAVFSYPALIASAPDHCTRIPGHSGAESLDDMQNYQIGCENKEMLGRMVARPSDLLGNTGTGHGTGRRAGAVVDVYQTGEPNDLFYPVSSASSVGR